MTSIKTIPEGLRLQLRLVPNASRNQIDGEHDGALKIRVQSPPVEGKANKALIQFLAKTCGVSKSSVRIVSGAKARSKRVEIEGDSEDLRQKILKSMA